MHSAFIVALFMRFATLRQLTFSYRATPKVARTQLSDFDALMTLGMYSYIIGDVLPKAGEKVASVGPNWSQSRQEVIWFSVFGFDSHTPPPSICL